MFIFVETIYQTMSKITPVIYTRQMFKDLRERSNVSVYRLAKVTGVSEQHISQFEREEKTIYRTTLTKLLTALYGLKSNQNG